MKTFDKAVWHIDGGENETEVVDKFKAIFQFLDEKKLLSDEGKELLEFGIDSSVSLNENMVTSKGYEFLDRVYDKIIECNSKTITESLERFSNRILYA